MRKKTNRAVLTASSRQGIQEAQTRKCRARAVAYVWGKMTGQLAKLPFGKVRARWAGAKGSVVTRDRLTSLNFRRIQGAGRLRTLLVQITVKLLGAGLQKTPHHSPWDT